MLGNQQRTTVRPVSKTLLVAVLVTASMSGLAGARPTDATVGPDAVVGGATELVYSDGDHVVFRAAAEEDDDHDHGHEGGVDAKGTASGDGPVVHDGFSTYGDATLLPEYRVRLVDSDGIEHLRGRIEEAASAAVAAGGPSLTVTPGTVPAGTKLTRGDIHIMVSSRSPCGGWWLGCGGPVIDDGVVVAGRIWISPRLFSRPPAQIDNTVRHELGHTMGLGHYSSSYQGQLQTMHATRFEARTYEAGDRAGLHFVTGKPAPDPSGAPTAASARQPAPPTDSAPPPEPRAVDPLGLVESAGSTPFGLVLRGWAVDPDSPAPVSVLVTIDGAPLEVLAHQVRPTGTADGFEVVYPVPAGTHEVCATARNLGAGADTFLGCRTVDVSAQSIGSVGLQTL